MSSFDRDGRHRLNKALDKYNETVGSLERNVLPSLRQMKEIGLAANDALPVLKPIDERSRVLTAPEAVALETVVVLETAAE